MTFAVLCSGVDGKVRCTSLATAVAPVPLCSRHRMQVALSIVPEMLATAAAGAAVRPIVDDRLTSLLVRRARHGKPDLSGAHDPRVYFVSNGGRIKIGYTTNLRARLSSLMLRADAVELFLDGGRDLEAALHRYFGASRIDQTEWFDRTLEITAYIQEKVKSPTSAAPANRAPLPPEVEVDLPAEELRALAANNLNAGRGVHLSSLLAVLHANGAPAEWRTSGLRRAYERNGFRVRKAIRVGTRVSVGIHHDDLLAMTGGCAMEYCKECGWWVKPGCGH